MKYFLILTLLFLSFTSFSQSTINGLVKDKKGEPIFAVNVYSKSFPQKGTTTDFDGNFNLIIDSLNDTLLVSYIGYETKEILLSTIDISKPLVIVLNKNSQTLEEVIIKARDPISEKFSVVKMNKMDIYFNPVSQADPLKAITILPASTTTDETANPSLRGSSADRTRVVLNGVPIYNPVKASQLNNQGFFSLFNPEIINKQYVYASNPPLTYGNTSAGLVEIQTIRNLETNQLQLSTSLASVGLFLSQKIKKDVSFIQIYGNYQFSDAFVGIQKDKLPKIKNFYTTDVGINFHTKIGKNATFNSYNYFIDEQFNGYNEQFTYKGNVATDKKRIFTVNNLKLYSVKGVLSINSGTNNSKQHFSFGNIKSEQKTSQLYNSIDYKWHLLENTNIQFGISHDFHRNKFKDSIPTYYYALSPSSTSYYSETSINNHILEAYLYTNWDINDKFTFSSGMRSNLPVENQKYYFSSQLGLKYRLNKNQSFLLSGGKYHNYSIPNYYSKTYNLLSSYQIALDYSYALKNTLIKAATYFKNETGEQSANAFFIVDKVNTFGIEFYLEHNFYKYFKFTFSNSFIDQKMRIFENDYHGSKDFNYLVKTTVQYNNPKLFSLALTYMSRPGSYYNEITGSTFDNQTNFYKPIFSNDLYNKQYGNYNRFDISLSKYIRIKNNALITFISLNNIFNTKNESNTLYNSSYSKKDFDYYQFRTVYFGLVLQLNY
ncbi:MAG: carboxypeptidase-like regulatory domain-containing protein [Urechidicola sp.]|nr:carboxypeptidase-like regulatory domain-containing protein [Urechidicola sp.]